MRLSIRQPIKFVYISSVYRQHCRRVQAGVFAEVSSTNTSPKDMKRERLEDLSKNDTGMVEKNTVNLVRSFIADAIRAGAPRFGFKPDRTVIALDAKQ